MFFCNNKVQLFSVFTVGFLILSCFNTVAKEKKILYMFYTSGDSSLTVRHDKNYSFFSLHDKNNYTFVYKSQRHEKLVLTSSIAFIKNLVDVKKLVNLNLNELDLIFSTDFRVKIIEKRVSVNGELFAIYPVEFFSPQNANDFEEFQAKILHATAPNTTKLRIGQYNYWIADSQIEGYSKCENSFTPTMNDIGSFVRHLNEREISWDDSLINFYCYGCISDGKRYLHVLRLDSLEIHNCFFLNKKETLQKKRNSLMFNLDNLYLENGPFVYRESTTSMGKVTSAVYNRKGPFLIQNGKGLIHKDSLLRTLKNMFAVACPNKRVVLWAKGACFTVDVVVKDQQVTDVSFKWDGGQGLFTDKELLALYKNILGLKIVGYDIRTAESVSQFSMQLMPDGWF